MSVQDQSPSPALPASRLLPVHLSQPPRKLETTQITRTETEIATYTYVRTLQKRIQLRYTSQQRLLVRPQWLKYNDLSLYKLFKLPFSGNFRAYCLERLVAAEVQQMTEKQQGSFQWKFRKDHGKWAPENTAFIKYRRREEQSADAREEGCAEAPSPSWASLVVRLSGIGAGPRRRHAGVFILNHKSEKDFEKPKTGLLIGL